jgi:hypothetical protein
LSEFRDDLADSVVQHQVERSASGRLAPGFGGVGQRHADRCGVELRERGDDLIVSHALGDHRHDRGDRDFGCMRCGARHL